MSFSSARELYLPPMLSQEMILTPAVREDALLHMLSFHNKILSRALRRASAAEGWPSRRVPPRDWSREQRWVRHGDFRRHAIRLLVCPIGGHPAPAWACLAGFPSRVWATLMRPSW